MLTVALSIALAGLAYDRSPATRFDHQAACAQIRIAAAQDDVQPGTVIDATTNHGGVMVDCELRSVAVRTLINRPVTKSWLAVQERYWLDDVCSDAHIASAVAKDWRVTQIIVVKGKVAATFMAACV